MGECNGRLAPPISPVGAAQPSDYDASCPSVCIPPPPPDLDCGEILAVQAVAYEYTHIGVARLLGMPTKGPYWSDLKYLTPSVLVYAEEGTWQLALVDYSGGLIPGLALLAVYWVLFLRRGYGERDPSWWSAGLFCAMLATEQIGAGISEGTVPAAYVARTSPVWVAEVLFYLLGAVVHVRGTRLWRELFFEGSPDSGQ